MAQLEVSVDEPQIVYPTSLQLNAVEITKACKELLGSLDLPEHLSLRHKFRLELRPNHDENHSWTLKLKLDAVAWFDLMEKKIGLQAITEKARTFYVQAFNLLRKEEPAVKPSGKIPVTPMWGCTEPNCPYSHISLDEYLRLIARAQGGSQSRRRNGVCKNQFKVNTCNRRVQRFNGMVDCTFSYLSPQLVIRPGPTTGSLHQYLIDPTTCTTGWFIRARPEDARDLVLCPMEHMTNQDLACAEDFWHCVKGTLDVFVELAEASSSAKTDVTASKLHPDHICEGIAFNFGLWETANAKEVAKHAVQYATDCHGHCHILLSPRGFALLEDIDAFKGMQGRYRNPESHLRKDLEELQSQRLLEAENALIRKEMSSMRNEMSSFSHRLTGLETGMSHIMDFMAKLEKKIDNDKSTQNNKSE